jgi:hypothetical protein
VGHDKEPLRDQLTIQGAILERLLLSQGLDENHVMAIRLRYEALLGSVSPSVTDPIAHKSKHS